MREGRNTAEELEGVGRRNLLGRVVDKMICHKDGAGVVFAPGVFGADAQDTLQTAFIASSKSAEPRSIRRRFPARAGGIADDQ